MAPRVALLALALLSLGLSSGTPVDTRTPAHPLAYGHGAFTQGARACASPKIVAVDSLEDHEDGTCADGVECTAREALREDCNFVVFKRSGHPETMIRARSERVYVGDNVTVLGATSPSGFGFKSTFHIDGEAQGGDGVARQVILSNLRFGSGDSAHPDNLRLQCNQSTLVAFDSPDADVQACLGGSNEGGACDEHLDCPGGVCVGYDAKDEDQCQVCSVWANRTPFDPDDWTNCNDTENYDGSINDALSIRHAEDVFVSNVSLGGSSDEGLSVGIPVARVTVQESIIEGGNDSRFNVHRVPGKRDLANGPHAFAALVSGSQADIFSASRAEGLSLIRFFILHGTKRCPKPSSGRFTLFQGVAYNCKIFFHSQPVGNANPFVGEFMQIVNREGQGSIESVEAGDTVAEITGTSSQGALHGACTSVTAECLQIGDPCNIVEAGCEVRHRGVFGITPSGAPVPQAVADSSRAYLSQFATYRSDGTPWPGPPTVYGDDWDLVPYYPSGIRDVWRSYRFEGPLPGFPDLMPPDITPGAASAELDPVWLSIKQTVGPTACARQGAACRWAQDAARIADYDNGTGFIGPQGGVYETRHEIRDDSQTWIDADGDNVADGWEMAFYGDLDEDGLGDPDGDGYRDVEEWAYGMDPFTACKWGPDCIVHPPAGFATFEDTASAGLSASFDLTAIQGATSVAPCAVKGDASGTTHTGWPRPFHTHYYRTVWGDHGAGKWRSFRTKEGSSRSFSRGPLAGHVYELPGVWAYQLEVIAPNGGKDFVQGVFTCEDPDVHFADAETYCFDPTGDFTGCPLDTDDDGACEDQPGNCVTSTDGAQALLSTCDVDSGPARCLFRGGETFTLDASIPLSSNAGPGLWESFGEGRAVFQVSGSFDAVSCGDRWTLSGLDIRGDPACTGSACGGIAHSSGCDGFTLYDSALSGFRTSPIASGTGGAVQQGLAIVDSDISFASTYTGSGPSVTAFLRAHDSVLLGSVFDGNGAGQFALRYDGSGSTPVGGAVICDNDFLGSSGRGPVTIRGDHPLGVFCQNSLTFTAGQNDVLTACADDECGSPDGTEAPTDWIFEANYFGGGTVDTDPFAVLELEGRDLTVRNNVIDLSGAPGNTSVQIFRLRDQNTGDASTVEDIHILGNTVYHAGGGTAAWTLCAIDAGVSTTGHRCWGNLAWIGTQGTQTKAGAGFDEDANVFADANPFSGAIPSPSAFGDFELGQVAGACGAGAEDCVGEGHDYTGETDAYLQRDGNGAYRGPVGDVGAWEVSP